jgi:hypothetical protein
MTPEEFQRQFMPYAQAVSQRTGLDPRLVLAQSALETGYGRSAPNNNFFGIKSHGQAGGSNLMTQEFENGQMVNKPQSFRGYESPEQSFGGYADFIEQNPRYQDVLQQSDLTGQIGAMGRSGYATDPDYARKLASIAQRFGGDVDMSQFSTRSAPDTPQAVGRDTRSTLGLLQNEGSQMRQDQPKGLLEMFGIQKRDPNAQGETAQPFYQRQTFGDTLARMAPALGKMGVMGLEGPAQASLDARNQRQGQERQMNKTIEWLGSQPGGAEFVKLAEAMGPQAALQAYMQANQPKEAGYTQVRGSDIGMQGESANMMFNVGPDGKITGIGGGAPVTNVTTNVGPNASAFSEETGKILAKEANEVVGQASIAQRSMGQLDSLEIALQNSPEGAGGAIANMAANIGIKTEGVENIELANAIISQLVPQQRPPGSGVMSDADLALFKASLPRLINTREGNQLIIDTMRNIAQYDMERGAIARRLQLGEIETAGAFAAYNALGNPLSAFQSQGDAPAPAAGGTTLTFNPETGAFD